jgi:hypothetical protein
MKSENAMLSYSVVISGTWVFKKNPDATPELVAEGWFEASFLGRTL